LRRRPGPGKGLPVTVAGQRLVSFLPWAVALVALAEAVATLVAR